MGKKHYILYSNRPFRDDRKKHEKEEYLRRVEKWEKENDYKIEPNLTHIIYYRFKPKFPDDFPKSLSAFSRMRNANSKNYRILMQKIENAGYKVPETIEEVIEEDNRRYNQ